MDFISKCKERYESLNTVLCLGLDPVLELIPLKNKGNVEQTLVEFYFSLLENFHQKVLAVKPNIAFYEQYGLDGLKALYQIIEKAQSYGVPVILDAKRGDIGNTSRAYAKAAFDDFKADAITLSPYLGEDSLSPFFEYEEKGFFILNRTSNKGSSDFQLLKTDDGSHLYEKVSDKIIEWSQKYTPNIGAVAGATHIDELERIARKFVNSKVCNPLLIPGVGKQGGDFRTVVQTLHAQGYPFHKVFINSSSKINYAYQYHQDKDYLEASSIEIEKLML